MKPIVLAFSGGLDTSWAIPYLAGTTGRPVATARASAIVVFLTNAGLPAEERLGGKATTAVRSKQPRVELVRN